MSDIIIAGNTYSSVPKIIVPTSTGVAEYTEIWNPWGDDAELVQTYDMGTTALEDTLFASWTPSTTAKAIQATLYPRPVLARNWRVPCLERFCVGGTDAFNMASFVLLRGC